MPSTLGQALANESGVHIVRKSTQIIWGELDLSLLGINRDWHGESFHPPVAYCLAMDPECLWFIAAREHAARLHPQARPGRYMPELWKYDVAELFLANPGTGRYLELNLAPNGAWWSGVFSGPRVTDTAAEQEIPGVSTHSELAPGGGWVTALSMPLKELHDLLDFGESSVGNATFILDSPDQRFLSATELGGGEPDFHRPEKLAKLRFHEETLSGLEV